ncbi:glycosyltransferase [Ferruginibacter sp. HRS2-29]|nr:glycosyltransferase [Ferruginibacter sp. HRS2-29]
MTRICTSLAEAGYDVTLVGRKRPSSVELEKRPYRQKRIRCLFDKGKLFYAEYNTRLFFYLLFKKMKGICAIDLDTILPCYYISRLKKIPRIYDAHELFCEMKEIVTRPAIYKFWKKTEQKTVPHFTHGYTVNQPIADEFRRMYGSKYEVVRSIARYNGNQYPKEKYILYQGAVNEGRSFETLIPAMRMVSGTLIVCGDGNFMEQAKLLAKEHQVEDKVIFKGMIAPAELKDFTNKAYIGITIFENKGLSNYFSLANRFFDYIQAGTPQLCVDYPVYREINDQYKVAVLINNLSPVSIAARLNELLNDDAAWQLLHNNCLEAAKVLNWENEEKKLIAFYNNIFG